MNPFHLAIPVKDLAICRRHQLVIHQKPSAEIRDNSASNPVDGHDVPVPQRK